MKTNDIKSLHDKTSAELQTMTDELSTELAKARFEKRAGVGKANLRKIRDDLARLKTILSEKLKLENIEK